MHIGTWSRYWQYARRAVGGQVPRLPCDIVARNTFAIRRDSDRTFCVEISLALEKPKALIHTLYFK